MVAQTLIKVKQMKFKEKVRDIAMNPPTTLRTLEVRKNQLVPARVNLTPLALLHKSLVNLLKNYQKMKKLESVMI